MVDPRIFAQRGHDAEGQRDADGEYESRKGQLERCRQAAEDIVRHFLAGGQGGAEIARDQVEDIDPELFGHGFVEPELRAYLGNRFRVCGRPGEIRRGVARQGAGQQKRDNDDADNGGHCL